MSPITAAIALFTDLYNIALITGEDIEVTADCLTAAVFGATPAEYDTETVAIHAEVARAVKLNPNNGWNLPRGVNAQNDTLFPGYYLGNSYESGICD
jgi:hypothetical protein